MDEQEKLKKIKAMLKRAYGPNVVLHPATIKKALEIYEGKAA